MGRKAIQSPETFAGGSPRADPDARRRAFSLVELVIVVVIIGIVSAIAVPRFTRAAASATATYVDATVGAVRRAMSHYYAEHGQYPGADPNTGAPNKIAFVNQLLLYSDEAGNTNATRGTPFIYGPYLRDPFPTNPFNDLDDVGVKAVPSDSIALGSTGWIAVLSDGDFGINVADAELDLINLDKKKVKVTGGL